MPPIIVARRSDKYDKHRHIPVWHVASSRYAWLDFTYVFTGTVFSGSITSLQNLWAACSVRFVPFWSVIPNGAFRVKSVTHPDVLWSSFAITLHYNNHSSPYEHRKRTDCMFVFLLIPEIRPLVSNLLVSNAKRPHFKLHMPRQAHQVTDMLWARCVV